MLSYTETLPPANLAPFVRCIWHLQGEHDGAAERILPDGSFELITHHGSPMTSRGVLQPQSMLMGEIRRPVVVRPSGSIDVSGLRFRAGGASAFFRMPMTELRDRILDVSDFGTIDLTPQPHRHWLLVRAAIHEIRKFSGDLRIRELARRVGVTDRTLERAFRDVVGMSAKRYARIVRFHRAWRSEEGLAYYDQSHKIHEFRELAGVTPTEFWRERNAINDAFVGNLQS